MLKEMNVVLNDTIIDKLDAVQKLDVKLNKIDSNTITSTLREVLDNQNHIKNLLMEINFNNQTEILKNYNFGEISNHASIA